MEYIDIMIKQIINSFDFAYMFIINVLSYFVVSTVYKIKKGKYVSTWSKRLILMACTVVVGVIYKLANVNTDIILIYSSIVAPVFWDWILRPIFIKLGIDYKRFENYSDDELHDPHHYDKNKNDDVFLEDNPIDTKVRL